MLSEKSRSSWFQNLSPIVGEDAVGEMLAHFPVTEGEQPATKGHVDVRAGELRVEMSELRVGMSELRVEFAEMHSTFRDDIGRLRVEMHAESKRLMFWLPGSIAAICAAIAFITRLTL